MKRWEKDGNRLKLYFQPLYWEDEKVVAEVYQEDDGDWYYDSDEVCRYEEWIAGPEITEDDLKLEMEEYIYGHYEDERNYYQELMDKFSGGVE